MTAEEKRYGVIRLNDTTDHGGRVISASTPAKVDGLSVACVGDMVECPKCKGTFPIIEGGDMCYHDTDGTVRPFAFHDHKTACGAKLIASSTALEASEEGWRNTAPKV